MQKQYILSLEKPRAPVCGMWEAEGLESSAAGTYAWRQQESWLDSLAGPSLHGGMVWGKEAPLPVQH